MLKIYGYECRRLLRNKFFAGLAAVLLLYGALVLEGVTILGVAHTAPFSPWSFGDYLSRVLPLLWIGTLFFLTFYTSPRARRAAILTDAAPMPPGRYALARCAAAPDGGGPCCPCLAMAEAAAFYGRAFGWYGWGSLAAPALAILLPPLVFALGSGWLLGRLRPLAPVCLDGCALPAGGPAPAGGPGAVERQLLYGLSPGPGDAGPGLLPLPGSAAAAQAGLLAAGAGLAGARPGDGPAGRTGCRA